MAKPKKMSPVAKPKKTSPLAASAVAKPKKTADKPVAKPKKTAATATPVAKPKKITPVCVSVSYVPFCVGPNSSLHGFVSCRVVVSAIRLTLHTLLEI